jgi:ATP-dependent Clp protease ATP-binding subunit ClpA
MADIDAYKDKFSESGKRVLETALDESKKRDQNYITIEHILHAIAREEDDLFSSTMRDLAVDPRSVKLLIEKRMESGRQHSGKGYRIAPETTELFKRAMDRARSQGTPRDRRQRHLLRFIKRREKYFK